jgi:hypothetical protein
MISETFRGLVAFRAQSARFWRDQVGETSTLSLILIATVLALGATVGLVTLRDQVVQELGDVSVSLERLDQSFDAGAYGSYTDTPLPPQPTDGSPSDSIGFP